MGSGSDPALGLHAILPAGLDEVTVSSCLDQATGRRGMILQGVASDNDSVTRKYCVPGGRALPFAFSLHPAPQLAMLRAYAEDLGKCPSTILADVFTELCVALGGSIARSDLGTGVGLVSEREVDGALEFVDWYQYFGPSIVLRIGRERVLTSPAFKVAPTHNGGAVVLAGPDPLARGLRRRPLAEHLGITLRPRFMLNPSTGSRVEQPWD